MYEIYHLPCCRNGIILPHSQSIYIVIFSDGLELLENEAVTNVTVLQRVGNTFRPRRKKNLLNADRIKGLTASLDSGIDTAEGEFLLAASHQLDNIHNAIYNVTESDKEDDGDVDDLVPAWLPVDEEPLVTVVGCVPPPAAAAAPQAAPAPLAGRGRPQRGCAATGPEAAPAAPPAGRGRPRRGHAAA